MGLALLSVADFAEGAPMTATAALPQRTDAAARALARARAHLLSLQHASG